MLRWILFVGLFVVVSLYSLQALRVITKGKWVFYVGLAVSIVVLGNFIYQFTFVEAAGRVLNGPRSYAFGFLLAVMAFHLVAILFLFPEDIVRLIAGASRKFFKTPGQFVMPERRRFLSMMAMSVAALPFGALLYGMFKGKYNFKVLKYTLEFDDLPEAFDGFQLTQISDVHSGSFDDPEKIGYAIELINEQKSDVILFTGDMVNNTADEMEPWQGLFSKLHAPKGKFSILGNHDYGDYVAWGSKEEKEANLDRLKTMQQEMGFDLLLNESRYLELNGDKIALVGVENWGRGGFKKAGDLNKAISEIQDNDFKVLLSHDPSHWEDVVLQDKQHIHLTLSGHTHGMQFGIEIPGWVKWSPAKWRYKYWAGIYRELGQYINVNRGFGYLGYPGRVGIWPEITVITLKKRALA